MGSMHKSSRWFVEPQVSSRSGSRSRVLLLHSTSFSSALLCPFFQQTQRIQTPWQRCGVCMLGSVLPVTLKAIAWISTSCLLRLLHGIELRALQENINDVINQLQQLTADPK